ncbi:uncharacterized protein LOC110810703 isoform X1 [Carica papaya]|uniref:uncharacterized protein LOC110810703 isoform X1 n=1 Tax=Carica papaya TaxID=3649 RepID=UPI000B8CFB19|nr:uncharacterized protein LOC110810703 isoform X1 [Carica papaya]
MTKSKAREATGQSSSHILLVFPNLNPGFLYRHQATAAAMVRPQMILLKEHAGISHSAQEPAYQQIKRPDVMMDVVRAALGTGAMDELIYDEKGGVAVDNDGANIMKILFANQQVQGLREYIIAQPQIILLKEHTDISHSGHKNQLISKLNA